MVANFFMLTCPYLYDFDTATLFAVIRNRHSLSTLNDIHSTAQVVFDCYTHLSEQYIHPLKVINRFSPTMYMLHHWDGKEYHPVRDSYLIAAVLTQQPQSWVDFSARTYDVWIESFVQANNALKKDEKEKSHENTCELEHCKDQLLRMMIARDPQRLQLAGHYFSLKDLVNIGKRLIGTGLIGGKSAGMLIAQAILRKADPAWDQKLEVHDSFYIGSDVYYTFLVRNKIWWKRYRLSQPDTFLEGLDEAMQIIIHGKFPQNILRQFIQMLNYYGQSPIIVRSSSLLEDAYGNSFSGKYESVFCVNQGTPAQRLNKLLEAVRKIYASTISNDALQYRKSRKLLDKDEQMAILIQRVSGTRYKDLFFPQMAGVGFSFNPFVWNNKIDPKSGVLRLVFGLGTRAVERIGDDYTRIVALNEPTLQIQSDFAEIRRYSQQKMDLLNVTENRFETRKIKETYWKIPKIPIDLFATQDQEQLQNMWSESGEESAYKSFPWVITFEKVIKSTNFIADMKNLLATLQQAYTHPVDIEYTTNFISNTEYRINLLQCRPFQVRVEVGGLSPAAEVPKESLICKTNGPIIGSSLLSTIDVLIYVEPKIYGKLPMNDRFMIARLIGKLTHIKEFEKKVILLIGPGRWGTTTPSLGVPVTFSEINTVSIIAEIAEMHEGLIPDISLGTHFFNDLVELNMLYFGIYPDRAEHYINRTHFQSIPNQFDELNTGLKNINDCVFITTKAEINKHLDANIIVRMDALAQKGEIYIKKNE
jgi:hypothetical protein